MLRYVNQHLDKLIAIASQTGGMWPSVVDTRSGCPLGKEHVPQRVYRLIGAPGGSTLYWDQPLIVAACALSAATGDARYSEAVNRYVDVFLSCCVGENGMFRWGNHAYYDRIERKPVTFTGGYHELRPITPAWDVFWDRNAEVTAAYIRAMTARHIYEPRTGAFNRHDTGGKGHAFLEAGGILCESLAWLYAKTGERKLVETALSIARYSYNHRDPVTGLVPNEPDMGRWDAKVCTSEIGLWAQCLLRAAQYTGCGDLVDMARDALHAYLRHAFDKRSGRYFGQVDIREGKPVFPDSSGYWPGDNSDPWNTGQWPTHDYPMAVADACLSLSELTGDNIFQEGATHWVDIVIATRPGRTDGWAYAESYGQCIHFLTCAGRRLRTDGLLAAARTMAEEALDRLWENGLFQGYPGSHVYESVDGVGVLLSALLSIATVNAEVLPEKRKRG